MGPMHTAIQMPDYRFEALDLATRTFGQSIPPDQLVLAAEVFLEFLQKRETNAPQS